MRISIDCWSTLLKSNPEFHPRKIELMVSYFPGVSRDHIEQCFKESKKTLNDLIESTGMQPHVDEMFRYLITKVNGKYTDFKKLKELINDYQYLALVHHPKVYSEETKEYLEKLCKLGDIVVSSNTMFIEGNVLRRALKNEGMDQYIRWFNFSDNMQMAKPSFPMYSNSDWHIGDNPVTDGIGAELAYSRPIIINSNELTIKDAYNIIASSRG